MNVPRCAVIAVLVVLFCLLVPATVQAHQNSVTYIHLRVDGRRVATTFRIDALDLNEAIGLPPAREVTPDDARQGAVRAARYITDRFTVSEGPRRCAPEGADNPAVLHPVVQPAPRGGFTLEVAIPYGCPHTVEDLGVHYGLFFDVDPRHQGIAALEMAGGDAQQVFKSDARDLRVSHPVALSTQLAGYVTLGIGHIFLGYDHIAFLMALLLAAASRGLRGGLRQVLAIVTAFTVAHSLTLGSTALGWIAVSPRVVEPAIAVSILVVAVENLLPREPRARWALAFAFGLVHGFGFAGVLAELGLPARGLVPSLLAFNLGVELGQLTVVAAAFPVLVLLARGGWKPWELALVTLESLAVYAVLTARGLPRETLVVVLGLAVPGLFLAVRLRGYARGARTGGSLVLAALAVLWFLERVSGHTVLAGWLG